MIKYFFYLLHHIALLLTILAETYPQTNSYIRNNQCPLKPAEIEDLTNQNHLLVSWRPLERRQKLAHNKKRKMGAKYSMLSFTIITPTKNNTFFKDFDVLMIKRML